MGDGNEIRFLEDQLPHLVEEAAQKRGDLWYLMRILNLGTEDWLAQHPNLKTSDLVDLILQDLRALGETREAAAYLRQNPDTNLIRLLSNFQTINKSQIAKNVVQSIF